MEDLKVPRRVLLDLLLNTANHGEKEFQSFGNINSSLPNRGAKNRIPERILPPKIPPLVSQKHKSPILRSEDRLWPYAASRKPFQRSSSISSESSCVQNRDHKPMTTSNQGLDSGSLCVDNNTSTNGPRSTVVKKSSKLREFQSQIYKRQPVNGYPERDYDISVQEVQPVNDKGTASMGRFLETIPKCASLPRLESTDRCLRSGDILAIHKQEEANSKLFRPKGSSKLDFPNDGGQSQHTNSNGLQEKTTSLGETPLLNTPKQRFLAKVCTPTLSSR